MATQIVGTNISAVPTTGSDGKHRHITEVQTSDGRVLTRSEVVARIQAGIEGFYTEGAGKAADVIVVDCPLCPADDYIKTTADGVIADNLLDQPSFTP
jgi:hypothetical protein